MNPLDLAIDCAATYRITRLLTVDRVAQRYRDALASRGETAAYYSECAWCTSAWVAVGVVAARRLAPRVWGPVATALAFSAVTGITAERL